MELPEAESNAAGGNEDGKENEAERASAHERGSGIECTLENYAAGTGFRMTMAPAITPPGATVEGIGWSAASPT